MYKTFLNKIFLNKIHLKTAAKKLKINIYKKIHSNFDNFLIF